LSFPTPNSAFLIFQEKKKNKNKKNLCSVAHIYNSLQELEIRKIAVQDQLGQKVSEIPSQKKKKNLVWWYTLVIPATWEA
jgi:hypothetical protein